MSKLTEEERQQMDELAKSISKLCHMVIARRLGQFFEVIKDELEKPEIIGRAIMRLPQ